MFVFAAALAVLAWLVVGLLVFLAVAAYHADGSENMTGLAVAACRHPAPGTSGSALVGHVRSRRLQAGGGAWEVISAGQAVVWRAGEEHTTKAVDEITAVVVEMPDLPLASR